MAKKKLMKSQDDTDFNRSLIYMSAETEAIIKISSYVHDIGVVEIYQTICLIAIAACIILLTIDRLIK